MARALLATLGELVTTDPQETPADPARILHAIQRRRPDGTPQPIEEPLIPLLDTTLLTNAPGEPGLWSQLRSEIESADAIDVVMAFIRRSGIAPLPLFTRLRANDRAFWFLGPARYIRHEGEKPMAITWELTHPLPGDLYASFAAAVA